jgi:hypothetical protein
MGCGRTEIGVQHKNSHIKHQGLLLIFRWINSDVRLASAWGQAKRQRAVTLLEERRK